MASSLVVSLNRGKLSHRFLCLQNSQHARLHSLCRLRFLQQCLSANAEWHECPEASVSSPMLASSLALNTLDASPSSSSVSSWVESYCSWSGVSRQVPSKAGQCMKAGSVIGKSLSCSCANSRSTHLVRPRLLGFCASTVAITFK